jgi:uncharacterized coiled-coil protein SlyX
MNEQLSSFLAEVQTHMAKTNEKLNAMCTQLDKLEERFTNMEIKIEANKLVHIEKSEITITNYLFLRKRLMLIIKNLMTSIVFL